MIFSEPSTNARRTDREADARCDYSTWQRQTGSGEIV